MNNTVSFLQNTADSLTSDLSERKTAFELIDAGLAGKNRITISVVQLGRDRRLVLDEWGQDKDKDKNADEAELNVTQKERVGYSDRLKKALRYVSEFQSDITIFPEFAFPLDFTSDAQFDGVLIAGQLSDANPELIQTEEALLHARMDWLKVASRRIARLAQMTRTEEPRRSTRALDSFLEKTERIARFDPSVQFYQNAIKLINSAGSRAIAYKNVLTVAELLTDRKQIIRGAGYSALKAGSGNILLSLGADFMDNTEHYVGEYRLILKLLKLFNEQKYEPMYRFDMQSLVSHYEEQVRLPILAVIAREQVWPHHHDRILATFRENCGLRLALYANGSAANGAVDGGSAIFFSEKDYDGDLPEATPDHYVNYRMTCPPLKDRNIFGAIVPRATDGVLSVTLDSASGDIRFSGLKYHPLPE